MKDRVITSRPGFNPTPRGGRPLPGMLAALVLMFTVLGPTLDASAQDGFPVLRGDYLGQTPPGDEPQLFAPGIISNGLFNRDLSISPDGDEIYVGLMASGKTTVIWTRREGGLWTEPEYLPFTEASPHAVFEPALSPDGNKLYFLTNQAAPGQEKRPGWGNQNIFVSERGPDGWGKPNPAPSPITTTDMEYFPSLTADGTMYFTRSSGDEQAAIYRSRLVDGVYTEPERLGENVNCGTTNYNAFIAHDESYIIVCVLGREDNIGQADYRIVFRDEQDRWSQSLNMGPRLNRPGASATSAFATRDGKYLFFSASRRADEKNIPSGHLTMEVLQRLHLSAQNGYSDIYWMNAGIIEELRNLAEF